MPYWVDACKVSVNNSLIEYKTNSNTIEGETGLLLNHISWPSSITAYLSDVWYPLKKDIPKR